MRQLLRAMGIAKGQVLGPPNPIPLKIIKDKTMASLSVDGRSLSRISFLQKKPTAYCAHFASTTSIDTDSYTYGKACANLYFPVILHVQQVLLKVI